MKKRVFTIITSLVLAMSLFQFTAYADIGPKPSVNITFENMSDEICYGTLLSIEDSTGPASAFNGDNKVILSELGEDVENIWKAFVEYKDTDNFYFLQWFWKCSDTKELHWTYYPPQTFKILLYYPKSNTFIVSDIYEQYAFDSYYKVEMDGIDIQSVTSSKPLIVAEKDYDYSAELFSLICRIILTILLEIIIALLFKFRERKLLLSIVYINIATQILLNAALNIINYKMGSMGFIVFYILLEIAVFIIEAILYAIVFNKVSKEPISKGKSTLYALIANACSFALGLKLAMIIPGIF